jgi:AraC-like DNA-binding protein
MSMYLYIQYMTSIRCKMAATTILENLHIGFSNIELGKVQLLQNTDITDDLRKELQVQLKKAGLALLAEKKGEMVEHTKLVIIEMVHYCDTLPSNNVADYIAEKMQSDYKVLSELFALVTGISIQQYIAIHKIERAKELLLYEILTLKEISKKLQYKSVEDLTAQFKKQTGLAPAFFVKIGKKRKQLLSK